MNMKNDNAPQKDELLETADEVVDTETVEDSTQSADATQEIAEAENADVPDEAEEADEESAETAKGDHKAKKKHTRADTRKLRYGGMATGLTVIVIAAVILVNVVAGILNDRYPLNIDLTSDKLFTLSDESKEIAKGVQKDVEITVFYNETAFTSPNTGSDGLDTVLKQFNEQTKLYNTLSGGKVTTSFVDLTANPTLSTKYSAYNVTAGSILFRCGDRYQVASISNLYSADSSSSYYTQSAPKITSLVEQMLGSKISMVTSDHTPLVTILTGHSEESNTLTGLKSLLGVNNYSTEDLDITASKDFNEESTIAVIAAPSNDYSKQEIDRLQTWLDNGGKYDRQLVVIVNYAASCPNLYEFLKVEYGIEVTDQLVVETDSSRVYSYQKIYPFADIASTDFTTDIAGSRALMPVCRQLLTNWESDKEKNSKYNIDLVTFPESSQLVAMADMLKDSEEEDSASPEPVKASEYPVVGMAYSTKWNYDSDNNAHYSRVLVSGSQMAFLSDVTGMTSIKNEELIVGVLNGFTGNTDSVTISSKSLDKTNLEFTTAQANIFGAVFVVIVPIALLVVCIIVFVRRRRL